MCALTTSTLSGRRGGQRTFRLVPGPAISVSRIDDDRRHRTCAPIVAWHESAAQQTPGDHARDACDIAQWAEMAGAAVVLVTRFDRHRYRADAPACRLDQDFALEHEAVIGQLQRQFDHCMRVIALAALRIHDALSAGPRHPEIGLLIAEAVLAWRVFAPTQARANDDMLRILRCGRE